ncbi:MAG: biopolymer transporter ExbD [Verrucomicrobiota bacterium]|nr:biopolymer transporter ExbD [Verrucomicrobiota bacterium]
MRFVPRKNRKPPTVIVVALIDVLMVVLIFMVVSTTFKNQAAVRLALPESSQAQKEQGVNRSLVVTVAKKPPYFYLDSVPIAEGVLEEEIKKALEASPERQLSIRSDTDAPFGKIIKVMDAAKSAGVKGVKAFTRDSGSK